MIWVLRRGSLHATVKRDRGPPAAQTGPPGGLAGLGAAHFAAYLTHDRLDATIASYGSDVVPGILERIVLCEICADVIVPRAVVAGPGLPRAKHRHI